MDSATRKAQRDGTLAQQLVWEVRQGRPERARLRAYAGCLAARSALGGQSECGAMHEIGEACGDLNTFGRCLEGIQTLAADMGDRAFEGVRCPCGGKAPHWNGYPCKHGCFKGQRTITTSYAPWLLAGAAVAVGRAVLPIWEQREGFEWSGTATRSPRSSTPGWRASPWRDVQTGPGGRGARPNQAPRLGLDAAARWVAEPTERRLREWRQAWVGANAPWIPYPHNLAAGDMDNLTITGDESQGQSLAHAAQILTEPKVMEIVRTHALEVLDA